MATKKPRVAIVHDWLVGGGAEQVVLQLHKLYPDAPIYTSYCTDEWRQKLGGQVITGYLQRWPFSKLYKFLPVLRAAWFSRLKLCGFDVVISSSGNGEANHVRVPAGTTHICYCHSPTHFYWRHYGEYLARPGFGVLDPVARLGLRILVAPLRRMDYRAAQRVNFFIANSTHIQSDIKKYYDRDAMIVFPPIDTERFTKTKAAKTRTGFVTVGRQKPYKYTELIVAACTQLELPLTVIGRGPEHRRLVAMAGSTVKFVTNASDEDVAQAMANAKAFVFASHEDFGITPVEAMAAGTPVIAYRAGGALDYVKESVTGLFFDEQTEESLVAALQKFKPDTFNHTIIAHSAKRFSSAEFQRKITQIVNKAPHEE